MKQLILVPTELEIKPLIRLPIRNPPNLFPTYIYEDTVYGVCGVGPAAAAMTTTMMLLRFKVERVILAGIAGAYEQSGLHVGDVVQGSEEVFGDLGYQSEDAFVNLDEMGLNMLPTSQGDMGCRFSLNSFEQISDSHRFLTLSAVTNSREVADKLWDTYGASIENMEGAAVAMACKLHGVPFHELRAVSNMVGPRDPSKWKIKDALHALRQTLERVWD